MSRSGKKKPKKSAEEGGKENVSPLRLALISKEEKRRNFSSRQSPKSAQNYRAENQKGNGRKGGTEEGRGERITITILLNNNRRFLPSFLPVPSLFSLSLFGKKRVGVDLNFNGGEGREHPNIVRSPLQRCNSRFAADMDGCGGH